MSPRQYRMGARAEAIATTRARIVEAAMALHAERGVRETGWDDIAATAGVSVATVYRHFPSLDELVPACARTVFDIIQPPTVDEAAGQFAALDTASDRLEVLVRRSCHCYVMGDGWLHAAHRERDFVPALDQALALIETTLHTLVDAAVGRRLVHADHELLFVLCNFPFWRSLRQVGPTERAAEDAMVRMVRTEASRLALDDKEN
jgi:AcrR family transcriptional regulator